MHLKAAACEELRFSGLGLKRNLDLGFSVLDVFLTHFGVKGRVGKKGSGRPEGISIDPFQGPPYGSFRKLGVHYSVVYHGSLFSETPI